MKYCTNCGTKLKADDEFCPKCGHRVNQSDSDKLTTGKGAVDSVTAHLKQGVQRIKPALQKQNKRSYLKWGIGLIVAVAVIFFGYRLVYLPHVVSAAVEANTLNAGGYTAKANTLTKTVVITTDKLKLERVMGAVEANDYDTTHIGAEMQLAKLEKDLPGDWTVEITQHVVKGAQTVLWRYTGDKETVRYQNSDECKLARKQLLQQQAQQQSDKDATTTGVTAGLLGGLVGGLLSR